MHRKNKTAVFNVILALLLSSILIVGCDVNNDSSETTAGDRQTQTEAVVQQLDLSQIPEYSEEAYVELSDNVPDFTDSDLTTEAFETYSELDSLGRCGVAYANICKEIMPTEERGKIGQIKPSGWHTVKYDVIEDRYLYNRCHLIGYQLAGENANEKNLITGTRYLNTVGMLPFENMVADYVNETDNHVLYRVTPVFEGDNLVASGVEMEALSVEDNGAGVCFHVFVYNVQPGIDIDYATGDSALAEDAVTETTTQTPTTKEAVTQTQTTEGATSEAVSSTYIANTNTKKFHRPACSSVKRMADKNKMEYTGNRQDLINQGYEPCKNCNP